jgi:hypothetical protein
LDKLKTSGCAVIHDIVAEHGKKSFNIDHVIVSPQGIFAVETKTYSKPAKESAKARFDGEKVVMVGLPSDNHSVRQAQANAAWLYDELKKRTQKNYHVTPVVVYPGWWVDAYISKEIWVLNPEGLAILIPQQTQSMNEADRNYITYLLSLMASN